MTIPLRTLNLTLFFLAATFSGVHAQTCQAGFSYVLNGLSVQFTQESTASSTITGFLWDFGDGASSTLANPEHTYTDSEDLMVCLTITTADGCTDQFCAEVEPCQLNLTVSVGDCNTNGEIPLGINITDVFGNAREINISIDGVLLPGSPFLIDNDLPVFTNALINGDGLVHTISVVSTHNAACTASYTFTAPDCASSCFLSGLNVAIAQGAIKTVNVGSNFFNPVNTTIEVGELVRFNWTTGGHTSTSDATSGPDSWNSGLLGAGATYDVRIKNPGIHPYYCIPHGGPGGVGMSGMIVANCPNGNNFTLQITFNTTQAGAQGYNFRIDGVLQPGSPFAYNGTGLQSLSATMAGDGQDHTFEIADAGDPGCSQIRTFTAPDCGAAPTCSMSVSAQQNGGCNVANQIEVSVQINSVNGGAAGFEVLFDGVASGGPYVYSATGVTTVSIFVPGDGQSHTISARDLNTPTCEGSTLFVAPDCSTPCNLGNITAATGGGITHIVEVQDFQFVPQNLTIAAGDRVEWHWTGSVAHTSTSDAATGADSWNSDLLHHGATYLSPVLSAGIHPYYCIPHGAPGGIGMTGVITVQANCANGQVPIALSFTESGGGFGGFQVWVDSVAAGTFAYAASGFDTINVLVPGDGMPHTLLVQDAENPDCSASVAITTPDCNASTCRLTLQAQENGPCDTLLQLPVEVLITDLGGGEGGFILFADSVLVDTFLYGANDSTLVSLLLPGDGLPHIFFAADLSDSMCIASDTLTTPNCMLPCQLSNLLLASGGGGDPVIHTVEVVDFSFIPNHINVQVGDIVRFIWNGHVQHTTTSDAITGPDVWNSGLLGHGSVFDVTITSEGVHPYYCIPHGAPGGIGMAGDITATPPCQDGMVSVAVSFDATMGSSQGYEVFVDGVQTGGPFAYNDPNGSNQTTVMVAGDGLTHNISLQDVDGAECGISADIQTPNCAGGCNIANLDIQFPDTTCNNGMIPASLSFTAAGSGDQGYHVFIDGILEAGSPHDYTPGGFNTLDFQINGDGGMHALRIEDVGNTTCIADTIFHAPQCPDACQIRLSTEMVGTCNGEGLVSYQIMVMASNVGSNGFNFFVDNLPLAGNPFPYGAGGISLVDIVLPGDGQIHLIAVADASQGSCSASASIQSLNCGIGCNLVVNAVQSGACNTVDQVPFNVMVQATTPGNEGFELLIDGVPDPGSPFVYQANGLTTVAVLLPGDGLAHSLQVIDVAFANCRDSVIVHTPLCGANCAMGNFSIAYNVPQTFTVEVRDFNFFPNDLTVSVGDTVRFLWTGQIPHTTTSDVLGGPDSWNSGLLGQGSVYDLVIESTGNHPYYCIPHGSPGGIGMSGIIRVQNPCDDGRLSVRVTFSAINGSFEGYSVYLDDDEFITSGLYQPSGTNQVVFTVPGDGALHHVLIQDATDPDCQLHEHFDMPDCGDPCFGFEAQFAYQINYQTLEVQFTDASAGMPQTWMWAFGDGQTSTEANPVHTFEPGAYPVCLAIENDDLGCVNVFCDTLYLNLVVCEPSFVLEHDGLTVFFKDHSQTSQPINNWIWTLGNGQQIVGEANPSFTYTSLGIYQICLTIETDSCTATVCQQIDLSNPCLAFTPDFSYAIDLEHFSVQFADQTAGSPHRWLWGFGDGVTSDLQNPNHTYSHEGVYNICLLVQDTINGCNKAHCELLYLGVTGTHSPDMATSELLIFPNPASTNSTQWWVKGLDASDHNRSIDYRIMDLSGRLFQKGLVPGSEQMALPVFSPAPPGVYFIEIRSEKRIYRGKLIVQ